MRARSAGRASRSPSAARRRPKARHRHGVPAFLAVRGADRGREHRARLWPRRRRSAPSRPRPRRSPTAYGLPLDPDALVGDLSVGERQRIEIVRCLLQKPQLIILDEPTSVLTPQEADQLFETLERLRSRGQVDPLHHAPAGRGEAHLRPRHHPAPRQGGRPLRSAPGDRRLAGPVMVGTEVKAVVRPPVEGLEKAAPLLADHRAQPQAGDAVRDPAARHQPRGAGRRGDRHRRRRRQRPGRVLRGALRRSTAGRHRRGAIRGKDAGRLSITGRRRSAPPSCRRSGSAMARSRACASRTMCCCRATAPTGRVSLGAVGLVHYALPSAPHRSASSRRSTSARARPTRRRPRSRAATCRNSSSAASSTASPAVLVVNQPTWGVDAGAAARIRQALVDLARARLGGAGDQPGPRRALRDLPTASRCMHNGELSKPLPRAEATREKIGLLMGGAELATSTTRWRGGRCALSSSSGRSAPRCQRCCRRSSRSA